MATTPPKDRPEPPPPKDPSVYGGQWGPGGDQPDPEDQGKPDRPDKIQTPNNEAPGAGEA